MLRKILCTDISMFTTLKEGNSFFRLFATPFLLKKKVYFKGFKKIFYTMSCLKNTPSAERPRERRVQAGPDALALSELLAIILSTGAKGKSVVSLAQELLIHFKTLEGLVEASLTELQSFKGIGKAKALQLKATLEIARRYKQKSLTNPSSLLSMEAIYHQAHHLLSSEKQEVLLIFLKDVRQKLITWERVSIGTLAHLLVHPREVFYPAVRHKAASFVLVHNHPSGDPTPSQADIYITEQLHLSSQVMGIPMEDHLIIGSHSFFSLKSAGILSKQTYTH